MGQLMQVVVSMVRGLGTLVSKVIMTLLILPFLEGCLAHSISSDNPRNTEIDELPRQILVSFASLTPKPVPIQLPFDIPEQIISLRRKLREYDKKELRAKYQIDYWTHDTVMSLARMGVHAYSYREIVSALETFPLHNREKYLAELHETILVRKQALKGVSKYDPVFVGKSNNILRVQAAWLVHTQFISHDAGEIFITPWLEEVVRNEFKKLSHHLGGVATSYSLKIIPPASTLGYQKESQAFFAKIDSENKQIEVSANLLRALFLRDCWMYAEHEIIEWNNRIAKPPTMTFLGKDEDFGKLYFDPVHNEYIPAVHRYCSPFGCEKVEPVKQFFLTGPYEPGLAIMGSDAAPYLMSVPVAIDILKAFCNSVAFLLAHELAHVSTGVNGGINPSEAECDKVAYDVANALYGKADTTILSEFMRDLANSGFKGIWEGISSQEDIKTLNARWSSGVASLTSIGKNGK